MRCTICKSAFLPSSITVGFRCFGRNLSTVTYLNGKRVCFSPGIGHLEVAQGLCKLWRKSLRTQNLSTFQDLKGALLVTGAKF